MSVNLHIPILVDSLPSRFIPPLSLSLPLPFFVAVVLLLKECPSFLVAFLRIGLVCTAGPADIIVFPDGEGRQSHSSHLPRHLCPDLAVRVVPQIAVILYISANGK